jgi:hypothetical protein
MKRFISIFSIVALLCIVHPVHAEFKAGLGISDVTPKTLMPISGGVGQPAPSKGYRGKLEVRALVVEQGGTRAAIVTVPYIGFPRVLGDRVRDRVKSVPRDSIMIGSTHTHSAPEIYGFPDGKGGTWSDLDYIDWACAEVAKAIEEGVKKLKSASVKIATGEAAEGIAYNYYAPQLYDPRANIIQFLNKKGKPFITLVNYAIHPEVLGTKAGYLSPDMVGPLHDRIEELGGGQGIFMNGAQGGMVTADTRRGNDGDESNTWEECLRIGNLLAEESLRIVKDVPVQEDPNLSVFSKEIIYPCDSSLLLAIVKNAAFDYNVSKDNTLSTLTNVVNLGNAQMLTIPGEALPNIGYYLKKNMHGDHNFLLGLTNDAFGYILTKEDYMSFKRYEYVSRTSLGEKTGSILVDESLAFVDEVERPK